MVVATDDERIEEACRQLGIDCTRTRDHPTGTDRIAECAQHLHADAYINVQGDEPLITALRLFRQLPHGRRSEPRAWRCCASSNTGTAYRCSPSRTTGLRSAHLRTLPEPTGSSGRGSNCMAPPTRVPVGPAP
ncbi:cytidylyltransferase domain-containing protein [Streptomyces sp. NPDC014870]|uniref:cytidylyltransferase domain-containing protein n=1 Tax=Streptomyces sp. NPDC014870 TaxID=3364925 RepID=UPI003700C1EB